MELLFDLKDWCFRLANWLFSVEVDYNILLKPTANHKQHKKKQELGELENEFFLSRPYLNENKQVSYISALWMVSSESSKRLHPN